MNLPGIIIFWILQWTWGLLQNIVGFIIFLFCIKDKHMIYNGCVVTSWKMRDSMSMGMFLFITQVVKGDIKDPESYPHKVMVHEFGHAMQSILLGPLYFFIISIPSSIWCNVPYFKNMRKNKKVSYYTFYPEKWANAWGEKVSKQKAVH